MAYRDLLLQLTTYPKPTPDRFIEAAAALANRFGARLSGVICQVELPPVSNFLADRLVGASAIIAGENAKSSENCRHVEERFRAIVPPASQGELLPVHCKALVSGLHIAPHSRVFDLTIVPSFGASEAIAEDLVFDAGRPVLLLPAHDRLPLLALDAVVIGWDGGRAAARAVADALPICVLAKSVKVVTITGDKSLKADLQASLERHLKAHGIQPEMIEHHAESANAGTELLEFCRRSGAGILVMGAYGHSQFREFILGGATRTILASADLPILMSH
jgi:nucleotide-binding universal stress UspA family protein